MAGERTPLRTDFGFPVEVHAHEPETIYMVPIKSDAEHFPPEGKLRVYRSRSGGNEWEALTNGLPQHDCYVNVLRDAMSIDGLDSCGVYFGTTGGQVYFSPDGGDRWKPIVRDLPPVLSVEVQTLPWSSCIHAAVLRRNRPYDSRTRRRHKITKLIIQIRGDEARRSFVASCSRGSVAPVVKPLIVYVETL